MKHTLVLIALVAACFLLWSCSSGTAPAPISKPIVQAAPSDNVEETILGLEHKWAYAIVNHDMTVLNELIADDFTGTSWSGDSYTKTKAVHDLEFGVYLAESVDVEGVKVRVFGDTAVVTLSQVEKSKYDNQDCSGRYGYSDVWVKRNGRWQAVSSYGRIE